MGQQQLLLIILGVIIVGIAIAVGITMFSAQSISANKDAILSDINNIGADAFQHKIRPCAMGGGGGDYTGSACTPTTQPYVLKATGAWGTNNPNADYITGTVIAATSVTVVATSKAYSTSTVTIVFDANGKGGTPVYTGQFL